MRDYTELLPKGKRNDVYGAELARQLCFKDTRLLRKDIARARAEGQIICSSARGYYLPETREEIQEFIRLMEGHARCIFGSLRSARRALRQIDGQYEINENGTAAGNDPKA